MWLDSLLHRDSQVGLELIGHNTSSILPAHRITPTLPRNNRIGACFLERVGRVTDGLLALVYDTHGDDHVLQLHDLLFQIFVLAEEVYLGLVRGDTFSVNWLRTQRELLQRTL